MNGDELGRLITEAVRFLSQFYQDVALLLTALDRLMAEQQWQPTEKTQSSHWLSNGMKPDRWVLKEQYRCFVRAESLEKFQDLVAFAILYDPRSLFDCPVVLAAAARFPAPTNYQAIPQRWNPADPVLKALAAEPVRHSLSAQEVASFLPGASRVAGFVVPLCHLTGTDTLQKLCIGPVLALEEEQRRQEEEQRRQKGEAKLAQAHQQTLNSTNGTQSADAATVSELCRLYGIPQEQASVILNQVWESWRKDHKPQ